MEQSDISLNVKPFQRSEISAQMKEMNEQLKQLSAQGPYWWEVGAPKYREMRRSGGLSGVQPEILDGIQAEVPSRDSGRKIPIRIMKPDKDVKIKSVFMYIHGGGWVLMAEDLYDTLIKQIANGTDSIVVSVGYRLAPEDPWPAGPNDCNDVADWLVENAVKEYGASFQFIGGDACQTSLVDDLAKMSQSAGGNLTMTTFIHLAKTRPEFHLSGLINYYGCFDVSRLPSAINYDGGAILTAEMVTRFIKAYCPNKSAEELKNPEISPLYQDLRGFQLPPSIFLCGTNDALCDDSAMMHIKWQMAGGEAITKFYPGVPHGFMSFPADLMPAHTKGVRFTCAFVNEKIR